MSLLLCEADIIGLPDEGLAWFDQFNQSAGRFVPIICLGGQGWGKESKTQ